MEQQRESPAYRPVTVERPPRALPDLAQRGDLPPPRLLVATPEPDQTQPVDGSLRSMEIGPLELELGGRLESVTMAYRTWGTLAADGANAVLVLHALTGESRCAGDGGWWAPLIGAGRAIDTGSRFVVCANILGGCQGSTGPASTDPATGRPYAMRFPLVTIGDMVAAQRLLVERLGVRRLVAVGGSIGGFQALEWATRHPDLVSRSIPIAANAGLGPQGIALNEAGRRAIMADADWRGGEYAQEGVFPADGLSIARMIAMVQFQSAEGMDTRFGRRQATRPGIYPAFGDTFDVEGYIHYHGAALVRRFDANSHLYLSRAMDHYDLGRDGGLARWLGRIAAPMLLVGIRSDWLFPAESVRALAEQVSAAGKPVAYRELDSPHGHDAFLKEWEQLAAALTPALHGDAMS